MAGALVSKVEKQLTGKGLEIALGYLFANKANCVFICLWQSVIRTSEEIIISSFLALGRLNMEYCFWCGPHVKRDMEKLGKVTKWRATKVVSTQPTRRWLRVRLV